MITVYAFKPAFQHTLRPAMRAFVSAGVTPNALTIAAGVLSIAVGTVVAAGLRQDVTTALLLLPPALLVRMALNALDGLVAREHAMQTPLGALLNELGDVVSDLALYLPLCLLPGAAVPVVALCLLAVLTEVSGILGVSIGASRRYEGPMGKSDRALCVGVLAGLLGAGVPGGAWVATGLAVMALLAGVTVVNRARAALEEVGA